MATRDALERTRRILKRDYNRSAEEINRLAKSSPSLEVVEQLDTLRISVTTTKDRLDDMYFKYVDLLDLSDQADAKLEEELMKERDTHLLNVDRAVSICNVAKRKFEGLAKRDSLNASVASESSNSSSSARLPKINVPTFNGDYRKFLDFKALYENLVHNDDNISPVRKMHYLKESLVGEAASTLANLAVSDDGYKEAWSRVLMKYDNKRFIVHTHFNDLFSAEKLKSESNLRQLVDRFDNAVRGFRICTLNPDNWSSILAYMLYTRLDTKMRTDFDNQVTDNSVYPSFRAVFKFCENRSHNIEARKFEEMPQSNPKPATTAKVTAEPKRSFLTAKGNCIACKEQHLLIDCAEFKAKQPYERLQLVRANKMCVNCFSRAHSTAACTSTKRCKVCGKVHHTLLHLPDGSRPTSSPATTATDSATNDAQNVSNTETKFTSNVSTPSNHNFVLLPSALVRFQCGSKTGTVRILLDDCSQPTLISDAFVKKFRIPVWKNPNGEPVHGIGFDNINAPHLCQLKLVSRINSFEIDVQAEVIPASAIRYSVSSISWGDCPNRFKEIKGYQLADPAFYNQSPSIDNIDILLGAEFSELCKINETVRIDQLTMRNTQFGWTLIGKFPAASPNRSCFLTSRNTTFDISDQLKKFWELENVPLPNSKTRDVDQCESYFKATTARDENGRFVVRLPFKESPASLAPNYVAAIKQLRYGEARRSTAVNASYSEFMDEYEKLGHMTKVTPTGKGYFIPHHAVLKPTSTTTKLRVVFNASSKTASKKSLNDILRVGPQLQPDLFTALVRFRSYVAAFTADISKMYRQVWVHPEDRVYQKILWRPSTESPFNEYELNTVTYGTAPASFLVTRCLQEVAEKVAILNPTAANAIRNHFYMDDLLTGADTIEEADMLLRTIHANLVAAGFELRKYQSNAQQLLQPIPKEFVESNPTYAFGEAWGISILGVIWDPVSDTLRVRTAQPQSPKLMTKRDLLSEVAKTFDPLGLISPFTIRAKIFIQRVWREGIDWDDAISEELNQEVHQYFNEIRELAEFSIQRPYAETAVGHKQLIGFCDASEKAFCATVYLRHTNAQNQVSCQLICAKTRVAPIKELTIPKLELEGATLLTELADRVSTILQIQYQNVFLFCDSEVALAWIAKPDNRWDRYVNHRVQKITAVYPFERWSHVRTKDNPADLGTRGLTAKSFLHSTIWASGPTFLDNVNFFQFSGTEFTTEVGKRAQTKVSLQVAFESTLQWSIIDRFSDYKRLIAVIGRVIRWVRKWRLTRPPKDKSSPNTLLSDCLSSARIAILRILQAHVYQAELEAIRQSKPVPKSSSLRTLDPFVDDQGLLRVTGRIQNSDFSYAKKHPIVIPGRCHFIDIYIDHIHRCFCHANKDFVLRFILNEFYPVGGLIKWIKARIRKCVICTRFKATTCNQILGRLPAPRVNISRPFAHTGVDFCGPFNCKCLAHRSTKFNKVYACIFVCMVTRAVHIETTSDLSSTVFLMALHRFISRRGLPAAMYSDRGTNFVGAKNYLDLNEDTIQQFAGIRQIKWYFNPPRTPHRGGLWEAAVKAAKTHLKKTILDQALNFEEFVTVFSRIEAILNSRPLCYRNATATSEEFVLTPSHFLIGQTIHTLPEPEQSPTKLPLIARYKFIRSILSGFWKVWRADYLNMLQRREKWQTRQPNIEPGQIVLMKMPTPPTEWPLAKVETVHPDPDGQVRTATVKCKDHQRCVDIRSLIKLPIDDEP